MRFSRRASRCASSSETSRETDETETSRRRAALCKAAAFHHPGKGGNGLQSVHADYCCIFCNSLSTNSRIYLAARKIYR